MASDYNLISEHNVDQLGKDTSSRKTQVSMYSDSTHFVYEILQNADDHGATEILFKLSRDELIIEHNGEPFNEENVRAITYFGKSTSREDLVKTGRFGIGFKSVFAFTATPIIISRPEHFQIYGLYRVREYTYPEDFSESRTRIILPFNHESEQPDYVEEIMTKEDAYQQISDCLPKLNINTLLFTQNIREISWVIDKKSMRIWREDEVDGNARLTIIRNGVQEERYLVFSKVPTWENEKHKPVEIAFAIDRQDQIISIDKDYLYVLFPTTENTGLKFLLNGPYRTNPARETVSKTDAFNTYLMQVTCELMRELLPKLKDKNLLNVNFLSILPNKEDELTHVSNGQKVFRNSEDKLKGFYTPLHDTIIHEFKNEKLTPTKHNHYFIPAKDLYRGTREISELIHDDDLAILLGINNNLPLWVANSPPNRRRDDRGRFIEDVDATKQNRRINAFLVTLEIPEWNFEDLLQALELGAETIIKWLKQKSDEWHQEFYAFLSDSASNYKSELSELRLVRCEDGNYRFGRECHFSGSDVNLNEDLLTVSTGVDEMSNTKTVGEEIQEKNFNYVSNAVYLSGNNQNQQESAKKFLETIGVNEVNETERIKVILRQRYSRNSILPHEGDMERFINLVKDKPETKTIFKDYFIFEVVLPSDSRRLFRKPNGVFLDSPFFETNLTTLYDAIGENSKLFKRAISPRHVNIGSNKEIGELVKFAEAVGVQTKLEVIKQRIPSVHPQSEYLYSAPGDKESQYSINSDYTIPEFTLLLNNLSIEKSKLIWRTMSHLATSYLKAQYRRNASSSSHSGDATLVHELRMAKWIPQNEDEKISFTRPEDASRGKLPPDFTWPKGYPDDAGDEWLKTIEFGKKTKEQKEKYDQRNRQAIELGFSSSEEVEKYAHLSQLLSDGEITVDDLISKYKPENKTSIPEFPTSQVNNPKFRQERVKEQLTDAAEKEYGKLTRSVRISKSEIDHRRSLIEWYTNENDVMVCQLCKEEMPFKKNDGEYYFIALEALSIKFIEEKLPQNYFPKEYEAQYLAFCPECAARYNYFAKDVKEGETIMEALRSHLLESDELEFPLKLGELETSIKFVDAHFKDLQATLHYYENQNDSVDGDD